MEALARHFEVHVQWQDARHVPSRLARAYLNAIASIPKLCPDAEITLARRIERGELAILTALSRSRAGRAVLRAAHGDGRSPRPTELARLLARHRKLDELIHVPGEEAAPNDAHHVAGLRQESAELTQRLRDLSGRIEDSATSFARTTGGPATRRSAGSWRASIRHGTASPTRVRY